MSIKLDLQEDHAPAMNFLLNINSSKGKVKVVTVWDHQTSLI